jgi:hypothetical protein
MQNLRRSRDLRGRPCCCRHGYQGSTRCLGRRKAATEDARNRALENVLGLLAKRKHLVQAIDQQIRDLGIKVSPVAIADDLDRIPHR